MYRYCLGHVRIRGFTARVEAPPLSKFKDCQRAFGEIIPTVEAHGGVVDKLLSDGLMALFRTDEAPIACCIELVKLIEDLIQICDSVLACMAAL